MNDDRLPRQASALFALVALGLCVPVLARTGSVGRPSPEAVESAHALLTERAAVEAGMVVEDALAAAISGAEGQLLAESAGPRLARGVARTAIDVAAAGSRTDRIVGRMEPGETWQEFAHRYALRHDEIARLNPRVDLEGVNAGAELVVYRHDDTRRSSSVREASSGRLRYGVPMPDGPHWIVRNPRRAYGTDYAVGELARGFSQVAARMPGTPPVLIADVSARYGGRLRPHRSHQSGRDADVTFYNVRPERSSEWRHTRTYDLDVARQWALFRSWIAADTVHYLFVDRRLIATLRRYAEAEEPNQDIVERAFGSGPDGYDAIIRHERGHADHFHVRFRCAPSDLSCRD